MNIRIKDDEAIIDGYVNAVERKSKPLKSRIGKMFVERIKKGAFQRSLERADDVRVLLNHSWDKDLGGIKDGNLKLKEDSIGLRAIATIKDPETIEAARNGDLVGWSFGFYDRDVSETEEDEMTVRNVKDLDLKEVSILDRRKIPAYDGTLITVRSEEDIQYRGEDLITENEITEEVKQSRTVDYTEAEEIIKAMKGA